jgi:hypothetical protein
MKISKYLALGLLIVSLTPVLGQPRPTPPTMMPISQLPPPAGMPRLQARLDANADTPTLTKFNLDFPGGTPAQLIKAIEKAMGKPLNVIIPEEDADVQLPPLKMSNVDVAQLFQALGAASQKVVSVFNQQFGSYSQQQTGCGFEMASGRLADDSVWYFHDQKPSRPPVISTQKICQFYSLSPYLDRGFTVDDITTAIQTGWKMAGVTSPPELNYHKETRLLIAFGELNELQTIQQVLQTLPQSQYSLPSMEHQMQQLQKQVDELKKKTVAVPTSSPNSSPEEKSGK